MGPGRLVLTGLRWWLAAVVIIGQVAFAALGLLAAAPVPAWARRAPVVWTFDVNIDKSLHFKVGYVRGRAPRSMIRISWGGLAWYR
jgi:hypothetical protein